jgi:hypothetical protein
MNTNSLTTTEDDMVRREVERLGGRRMIKEGKRSVGSQVRTSLELGWRVLAFLSVWWFGAWTLGGLYTTEPFWPLVITWAIVTIASLLFGLTGWPFKRKRNRPSLKDSLPPEEANR